MKYIFLIMPLLLTGCLGYISKSDIDCLHLGMTKEQTAVYLGHKGTMRKSIEKRNNIHEYLEYTLRTEKLENHLYLIPLDIMSLGLTIPFHMFCNTKDKYWFYFFNNELRSWGYPSDFKKIDRHYIGIEKE